MISGEPTKKNDYLSIGKIRFQKISVLYNCNEH